MLQSIQTWRVKKKWAEYTALLETRQWDVEILISKEVKFRDTLEFQTSRLVCGDWLAQYEQHIFLDETHQQGKDTGNVVRFLTEVNYSKSLKLKCKARVRDINSTSHEQGSKELPTDV